MTKFNIENTRKRADTALKRIKSRADEAVKLMDEGVYGQMCVGSENEDYRQSIESLNLMTGHLRSLQAVLKDLEGEHFCCECKRELTLDDKKQYEGEGGEGYPGMCIDCAEQG